MGVYCCRGFVGAFVWAFPELLRGLLPRLLSELLRGLCGTGAGLNHEIRLFRGRRLWWGGLFQSGPIPEIIDSIRPVVQSCAR